MNHSQVNDEDEVVEYLFPGRVGPRQSIPDAKSQTSPQASVNLLSPLPSCHALADAAILFFLFLLLVSLIRRRPPYYLDSCAGT